MRLDTTTLSFNRSPRKCEFAGRPFRHEQPSAFSLIEKWNPELRAFETEKTFPQLSSGNLKSEIWNLEFSIRQDASIFINLTPPLPTQPPHSANMESSAAPAATRQRAQTAQVHASTSPLQHRYPDTAQGVPSGRCRQKECCAPAREHGAE